MKLRTKYLGEVEADKEKIIRFPKGIPGFLDETEFVILDLPNNSAFQLLQSVKTEDLAFVITNPYLFVQEYTFNLDDNLIESLEIKEQEEVAVYTIITVRKPFKESTMNLRAPIIINTTTKCAKQYILNDSIYSSKKPITLSEKGVG